MWLNVENKRETPPSHKDGTVFVSLDWWYGQIKVVLVKAYTIQVCRMFIKYDSLFHNTNIIFLVCGLLI